MDIGLDQMAIHSRMDTRRKWTPVVRSSLPVRNSDGTFGRNLQRYECVLSSCNGWFLSLVMGWVEDWSATGSSEGT